MSSILVQPDSDTSSVIRHRQIGITIAIQVSNGNVSNTERFEYLTGIGKIPTSIVGKNECLFPSANHKILIRIPVKISQCYPCGGHPDNQPCIIEIPRPIIEPQANLRAI